MAITWDGAQWAGLTPYAVGARAVNGANAYACTTAGVSGVSGGPTGTGADITDGTVHWSYLGAYTGSVLDVAPELATGAPITPSAQGVFLALAERLVADVTVWADLLDDGRRYLAAHFAELARLRGRGPISAETIGPLSRSYAALSGAFSVEMTPAGRAYMDLVRTTTAVFGFVG